MNLIKLIFLIALIVLAVYLGLTDTVSKTKLIKERDAFRSMADSSLMYSAEAMRIAFTYKRENDSLHKIIEAHLKFTVNDKAVMYDTIVRPTIKNKNNAR